MPRNLSFQPQFHSAILQHLYGGNYAAENQGMEDEYSRQAGRMRAGEISLQAFGAKHKALRELRLERIIKGDTIPKSTTIRTHAQHKPGDIVHLVAYNRKPACFRLGTSLIVCARRIVISARKVYLGGCAHGMQKIPLEVIRSQGGLDEFARAEGFHNWLRLLDWFLANHSLPFKGIYYQFDPLAQS